MLPPPFICLDKVKLFNTEFILLTAIGNAVAVLTDAEKRKQYDLYGADEERMTRHRGGRTHQEYNYTRGFEGKWLIYFYKHHILFRGIKIK